MEKTISKFSDSCEDFSSGKDRRLAVQLVQPAFYRRLFESGSVADQAESGHSILIGQHLLAPSTHASRFLSPGGLAGASALPAGPSGPPLSRGNPAEFRATGG